MKLNKWYNFLLTILFWIFTWETYNALIDKYNLTDNQNILWYVIYSYYINI